MLLPIIQIVSYKMCHIGVPSDKFEILYPWDIFREQSLSKKRNNFSHLKVILSYNRFAFNTRKVLEWKLIVILLILVAYNKYLQNFRSAFRNLSNIFDRAFLLLNFFKATPLFDGFLNKPLDVSLRFQKFTLLLFFLHFF